MAPRRPVRHADNAFIPQEIIAVETISHEKWLHSGGSPNRSDQPFRRGDRMKKRLLPTAALAVAALALAGCSSGGAAGPATSSADATDAKGQKLSVWIMQGTNPDSTAFFDEVGDAFTKETGATLDVQYVQWADAHDRFVTSIAG